MSRKRRMVPHKQATISKQTNARKMWVKWGLGACLLVSFLYLASALVPFEAPSTFSDPFQFRPAGVPQTPEIFGFEVLETYEHDPGAFSQGFLYDEHCNFNPLKPCDKMLWESTGLYGKSTIRLVDLASGKVLKKTPLPNEYFGEGLAKLGQKLYQLTWQRPRGFIFNTQLEKIGEFDTPLRDGWGLTTDGKYLIATDSSEFIYWLDPNNFEIKKTIIVKDGERSVKWVNEVEWIDGEIWGNIWQTDCIAKINPKSGQITGWIYLGALTQLAQAKAQKLGTQMDVLNGIAWDSANQDLYLTGKLWPSTYRVKVSKLKTNPTESDLQEIRARCIR